jgi:hypothetical protein
MPDEWCDHLWKPGERDAALAALVERREANAEELPPRPTLQAPTEPPMEARPLSMPAETATKSAQATAWADWVEKQIKARSDADLRVLTKGIAEAMVDTEKARQAAEVELKAELAALRDEIAQLRARIEALEAGRAAGPSIRAMG